MTNLAAAANPRHGRPPRYVLAGLIGSVLFLMLLMSTAMSGLVIGAAPGIISFLGLPLIFLIALATWFLLLALDHDPQQRRRHLVRAGITFGSAVLLWLLVIEVYLIGSAQPGVVAVSAVCCAPTTAFGLWVVRRLDRSEKEPWRLMLVAAAWGGIVAVSLVIWANTLLGELAGDVLVPGPGLDAVTAYGAGVFEEIAKGLAVLLLYLVMRGELDDVVDGIIYGAAVGLGFNFMETILYMSRVYEIFDVVGIGGAAAFFQWYFRQVLGLFFGHATYTALTGAGIGIARQLASPRHRVIAITCGWLTAIAAHFAWDAWIGLFPVGEGAVALLGAHLRTLVMDGPFTAIVLLLLAMGLNMEGKALRRQLELEAGAGTGAVVPAEVPILINPWRRLRARWNVFARHGIGAYRRLRKLQGAQLDLAMERWHRERQEIDQPLAAEDELRARVLALRG